ncbi:MAG: NAD(P)H-hydrate dehydratase [Clostridium sp.]|uniref:NAD(P)H-hydrate dehydratase n=1 Tax=Clostridium sp. TaxID=1506 RepID=UPI003EE73121
MEILSKESCAKIDKQTIEEIGIPSIVLMENVAERISREIFNESEEFIIVAGIGNNGGDALNIGRKLYLKKKKLKVYVVGKIENGTKDFKINLEILNKIGVKIVFIKTDEDIKKLARNIREDILIIDGIFGIGLNRKVNGIYKEVIEVLNKSRNIISIDVPSGLDSNTGNVLGVCIKARKTYTIECLKIGFIYNSAINNIGEVHIIEIDVPNSIKEQNTEKIYALEKRDYINKIPKRDKISHKGNFGKVAIVGGNNEYVGAVYIASEAAVKMGSGLVTMIVNKDISTILKVKTVEAMVREYDSTYKIDGLEKFDVLACGPGMGNTKESKKVFEKVIKETNNPIVIDADGLNILSENDDFYKYLKGRAVLTPHLGEMCRLTGIPIESVEKNKIEIAKKFAREREIVLLLKGYNTIITDGEEVIVNRTGSSKMASGGMGDCLTGIITSLIGQGLNRKEGAVLGAYIHGYTGDKLGKELHSVSARDIIDALPKIIEELLCEN